ncbi:TRAP transporter small permease subunit [Filomicrobium sp.]|uniref:TRAP transporter small permease n=1 Tax=Filomicrobium sp. TaxID=2024831 RepID=UPI00258A075F|nr:TRAP transporter small permease subunit [Filomicrobium sp.]MCV0370197.1 TRAP transporter small permease subunit [Filomicrobium sp.]
MGNGELGADVQKAARRQECSSASMFRKIDSVVTFVENSIMLVSYATLIAIIGFETIRRVFWGSNWLAGPDIALYAFVWLSWFAMAHNIHNNAHLSFTEFRERFPPKIRACAEVFDCLLWLGLAGIVIVTSWGVVERQIAFHQTIFGTNIPLAVGSLAIPVAWGFTVIRILQRLYRILFQREEHHTVHVPPELI